MKFEAIIFDYVGVLVEMDRRATEELFRGRVPLPLRALIPRWEQWCLSHIDETIDAREIWCGFWDSLRAEFTLSAPDQESIYDFDYLSLFRAYPDTVPALTRARQLGLRIGVLSNSALPKMEALSAPLHLASLADVICVPGANIPFKPDAAGYLALARRLETSPERCLYFDDEPVLVAGARRVGMVGYLVDRSQTEHSLETGSVKDLSAISVLILDS